MRQKKSGLALVTPSPVAVENRPCRKRLLAFSYTTDTTTTRLDHATSDETDELEGWHLVLVPMLRTVGFWYRRDEYCRALPIHTALAILNGMPSFRQRTPAHTHTHAEKVDA